MEIKLAHLYPDILNLSADKGNILALKRRCEKRNITLSVKEYGIEISSIQVKPKYVFGQSEKIIDFCKATGCKNVVISMLPFGCILGNELAEVC